MRLTKDGRHRSAGPYYNRHPCDDHLWLDASRTDNLGRRADNVPHGFTERQLIERHSSDAACAKCHQRVDPLGFALEGYDAIGRRRERNQAGLEIDTKAKLKTAKQATPCAIKPIPHPRPIDITKSQMK